MERLLLVGSVVTMAIGMALLFTEFKAAGATFLVAGVAVGSGLVRR